MRGGASALLFYQILRWIFFFFFILQPSLSLTIESPCIIVFYIFLKVILALLSFLFSDGGVMFVLHLWFSSCDVDLMLVLPWFCLFCDDDVMLVLPLLCLSCDDNVMLMLTLLLLSCDIDVALMVISFLLWLMLFSLCCCTIEFSVVLINAGIFFSVIWDINSFIIFFFYLSLSLKKWFYFRLTQFGF